MQAEDQAHVCPIRALAEWVQVSGINKGYLFRRIWSGDRVADLEKNTPMVSLNKYINSSLHWIQLQTSEQFLELFRNNLLDININHYLYGTHSFRRGGCQYFAAYRRWSLRRICDWGGWSTEFSNLTIVKYLISWNDNPLELREDFLDPNRAPAVHCSSCGRSCHCAWGMGGPILLSI